jgi:class 3 adenylate cyclase
MEGFTSLTEKLGSEEMYSVMDQVYEILIRKVHDYEGTVNELTGEGIMALFGVPIALEDAPQGASRSALAIHREMNKFSDQLKSEKKMPPIKMRIGIHTGPVIVGTLGNDLRGVRDWVWCLHGSLYRFRQWHPSVADIFFRNVVEEDMNLIRRDLKGLDNRIRHFLN